MLTNVFATALLVAGAYAQEKLTINTPSSLTQCQPVLVSWSNGQAPYIIKVIPGGQQSAPPLKTLTDDTNANSLTWMVDLAPQDINIGVTDATGVTEFTAIVKINPGNTACMNSTGNSTNVTPGQPGTGGGNSGNSQTDGGAQQTTGGGNTQTTDGGAGGQTSATQTGGSNPPATSAPSSSDKPGESNTAAPPAESTKPSSAMKLASVPAAAFVAAALFLSL